MIKKAFFYRHDLIFLAGTSHEDGTSHKHVFVLLQLRFYRYCKFYNLKNKNFSGVYE